MKEYFADIMKNPEEYLTPQERKVLDDEEIPVKDIRVLAYNQGVTLRGYMNRLRGIEKLPEERFIRCTGWQELDKLLGSLRI